MSMSDIVKRLDGYAEIPDMDRNCQRDIYEAAAEIRTLRSQVAALTTQRDAMVEALESVVKLDKTQYEHHEPRPDGTSPRSEGGSCWYTPKQIARSALALIKQND